MIRKPDDDPQPPPLDRRLEQIAEWKRVRASMPINAPPAENYNPQSSAELRTPDAPPSAALLKLIAEQDAER